MSYFDTLLAAKLSGGGGGGGGLEEILTDTVENVNITSTTTDYDYRSISLPQDFTFEPNEILYGVVTFDNEELAPKVLATITVFLFPYEINSTNLSCNSYCTKYLNSGGTEAGTTDMVAGIWCAQINMTTKKLKCRAVYSSTTGAVKGTATIKLYKCFLSEYVGA